MSSKLLLEFAKTDHLNILVHIPYLRKETIKISHNVTLSYDELMIVLEEFLEKALEKFNTVDDSDRLIFNEIARMKLELKRIKDTEIEERDIEEVVIEKFSQSVKNFGANLDDRLKLFK